MKLLNWCLLPALLPAALFAQLPPPVIPAGVGVNIHFVTEHERDLDMIAQAGFKFVRMDFSWQDTEPKAGTYNWIAYDELTGHLAKRGLRAIYILDYVNPAYEPTVESRRAVGEPVPEQHLASPRHPESVAAFARWAAAAARHFRNQSVIWEIYNEPNGDFWRPKPNVAEYTALALATAKAVRQTEPSATIIAPAMSGFDWPFLEPFLASGVLEDLDAVSVHPYRGRDNPPESASPEYQRLRELIDRCVPISKRGKIPILSGEWGYPSHRQGVSLDVQAQFAVRQQLSNLLSGVPLSIWYDWKNDGTDPNDNEQNFGTVTSDLQPKPAYDALRQMTHELDGYTLQRRIPAGNDKDFVLLFVREGAKKIAAWTLAAPHPFRDSAFPNTDFGQLGSLPKYIAVQ